MCLVCALAVVANRPRPRAPTVAVRADLMIPRLFTYSSRDISAYSALVPTNEQLRLGGHVLGDAHHEKLERLCAGVFERPRFADLDWNRVSRFNGCRL